jgi:hypothetical protein
MPLEFMYCRPPKSSTTALVPGVAARSYASERAASLAPVTSPASSITLQPGLGVRTSSRRMVVSVIVCLRFDRRRAPARPRGWS